MPQLVRLFLAWSGLVPKFSLYDGWVRASCSRARFTNVYCTDSSRTFKEWWNLKWHTSTGINMACYEKLTMTFELKLKMDNLPVWRRTWYQFCRNLRTIPLQLHPFSFFLGFSFLAVYFLSFLISSCLRKLVSTCWPADGEIWRNRARLFDT